MTPGFSGNRLENEHDLEKAIEECNEALKDATGDERQEILERLGDIYNRTGEKERAVETYKMIREEVLKKPRIDRKIGNLLLEMERYDDAEELLTISLEKTGDDVERARTRLILAELKFRSGDPRKAAEEAKLALSNLEAAMPTEVDMARAHDLMGVIQQDLGRLDLAKRSLERALRILRSNGDDIGEARTLNHLGLHSFQVGNLNEAVLLFEQALDAETRLGDLERRARVSINIGQTYSYLGELDLAREHLEKAVELFEAIGSDIGKAQTTQHLGRLYHRMQQLSRSRKYFEDAITMLSDGKEERLLLSAKVDLMTLRLFEGRSEDLGGPVDDLLVQAGASGLQDVCGRAQRNKGILCLQEGDPKTAIRYLSLSLHTFDVINSNYERAITLRWLGQAWRDKGDKVKSEVYINESIDAFKRMGAKLDVDLTERIRY